MSATDLSTAIQNRVTQTLKYACLGAAGQFSQSSIYVRDLDGDGKQDMILDHCRISCSFGTSLTCGAHVCSSEFFLQRGGRLEKVTEFLNGITGIRSDRVPTIGVWGHGGTQRQIRWNGQAFAPL